MLSGTPPYAFDDFAFAHENAAVEIRVLENDGDEDGDPLGVVDVDISETLGRVTVGSDGVLVYEPGGQFDALPEGEIAYDGFGYTISDGVDGTATAWVTVAICGVNNAPVAGDDLAFTDEDTAVAIDVLTGDADPDGDGLELADVAPTSALGAALQIGDGGQVWYDPRGADALQGLGVGETIEDTFTYTITDAYGATAMGTVTVYVAGVNDDPWAADQEGELDEDATVVVEAPGLLRGAGDPDIHDVVFLADVDTSELVGTLTWSPDGGFTYSTDGQFDWLSEGDVIEVSFTFTVNDGHGGTASGTATGIVYGTNDLPVALDDEAWTDQSNPATIAVLANDGDVDQNDVLSVIAVDTEGTLGQVIINGDGTLTYDPAGQFAYLGDGATATDAFSYTIEDGHGGTATAWVWVTITGLNDAPVAIDSFGATDEDTPFATDAPGLLGNDYDPDEGDLLSVIDVEAVDAPGQFQWESDGSFYYDPDGQFEYLGAGQTAEVWFRYTISDGHGGTASAWAVGTIFGVNDAPVPADDASATEADSATVIDVLANDTDVDLGDTVAVVAVQTTTPVGAAVAILEDGRLLYDPAESFALQTLAAGDTWEDVFWYTVSDQHGATATALVTITVTGVNDPPVAVDDEIVTDEHTAVGIDVLANDYDPDTDHALLRVTRVNVLGTQGRVTVRGNGQFTYYPNGRFDGLSAGQSVVDSLLYTITDRSGGYDTARVYVLITGTNDPVIASPDEAVTDEDTPVVIDVLANDRDLDALDVPYVLSADATSAAGALIFVNADGTIVYDPAGRFDWLAEGDAAADSFSYTATDGHGSVAISTVTVTIFGANDGPIPQPDEYATEEDTMLWIDPGDLVANDEDPEDDELFVVALDGEGTRGALGWTDDGAIFYDPSGCFDDLPSSQQALDRFSYAVSDGHGHIAWTTVFITIHGVNHSPEAFDDEAWTDEDSTVILAVLDNDTDVDAGDQLAVVDVDTSETVGLVTVLPDGTIAYDPDGQFDWLAEGELAEDSFTYDVVDLAGGWSTATVTIVIVGRNDAPTPGLDQYTATEDGVLVVGEVGAGLLANDADAEGDVLWIVEADSVSAAGAQVAVAPDGTFLYDPTGAAQLQALPAGATLLDVFWYSVGDGQHSASSAVQIRVTGANDAPYAVDDAVTLYANQTAVINVLANDGDPDFGDVIWATSLDATGWIGLVTINPQGVLTYNPNGRFDDLAEGESATDQIIYRIRDSYNATAAATVTVTILGVAHGPLGGIDNHPPVAHHDFDEEGTLAEDHPVTVPTQVLLENDFDPDGDPLQVVALDTTETIGKVTLGPGATFTYDPQGRFEWLADGETAVDAFWYTVSDGRGGSAMAQAVGLVVGANDGPTITGLDLTVPAINEGDWVGLQGVFADPDKNDWHAVTIDWGDGTTSELELAFQARNFEAWHRYADDEPTGTLVDVYPITVTVHDNHGAASAAATEVQVFNLPPWIVLEGSELVDAGQPLELAGRLEDPGADTWWVQVDYGDGSDPETLAVAPDGRFHVSHLYPAPGIYELTLTAVDDDGGWSVDHAGAVVFRPQGTLDYRLWQGLNPSDQPVLFSFQAAHTGLLTVEATFEGDPNHLWLLVGTPDQDEPIVSTPIQGRQRIDCDVQAGQKYYLVVLSVGDDFDGHFEPPFQGPINAVDVRLVNLVSHDGETVTVLGTDGPDQFEFYASQGNRFVINQVSYRFDEPPPTVRFLGAGANDSALLNGSTGDDNLQMRLGSATLAGLGFTVDVLNTPTITAWGRGGHDVVQFFDSPGNDRLVAQPLHAVLTGSGCTSRAKYFDTIFARATAGTDTAFLYDSPGNDVLVCTPTVSRLTGSGYQIRVTNFDRVFAEATNGGTDRANLYDSAYDDRLEAAAKWARLSSVDQLKFLYEVTGFKSVNAIRSTGNDTKSIAADVAFLLMLTGW